MPQSKGIATTVAVFAITFLLTAAAAQSPYLYGNNTIGAPGPYVYKIDKTNGVVVDTYTNLSGSAYGRGVLVIGNTMYYTDSDSNQVYGYDISTHQDMGVMFTVSMANHGLASIAYDGNGLWIQDYAIPGSTKVFHYSLSGSYLGTINVTACAWGNCDGLGYFGDQNNSWLISNRGDSIDPYDLYDTNGIPGPAGFIIPSSNDTGITWDCSNFYTSDPDYYHPKINVWNSSGGYVNTLTLSGWPAGYPPLIEGLSTAYAPPPSPSTNACPTALGVTCVFFTGNSYPGICGRQATFLPNEDDSLLSNTTIYESVIAPTTFTPTGMFINSLITPGDIGLYTSARRELRVNMGSDGNPGILLEEDTCSGSDFSVIPNGQDLGNMIGVWFVCKVPLAVHLAAGQTYWFSLTPSAGNSAAHHTFQWASTQDPPLIGAQQEQCGGPGPAPNCAFFNSPQSGSYFANTRDNNLPYPTATIKAGVFSWGLF